MADDIMTQSAGVLEQKPPNGYDELPRPTVTQAGATFGGRLAAYSAGSEGEQIVHEVRGAAGPGGGSESEGNGHSEASNEGGGESGEEFLEASPAQLAAESGEESAVSDLQGLEGFSESWDQAAGESAAAGPLEEAGTDGADQEFLPFLAALAPTLISTVGPMIARGIAGKLSPKTRQKVSRIARAGARIAGPAGQIARGAGAPAGAGNAGSIISMIAKLLEGAQKQPVNGAAGTESGAEFSSAIVEQAVAAMEVIIGADDRIQVTRTTDEPWRRLCALRITFPSGATYRGTGFFIGPRAVATAGHCVYLHNQGGWARSVQVIPGCNGSSKPYGQVVASSFRSVSGWTVGKKPESDYGCIVLPQGSFAGKGIGSFGFANFTPSALLAQPAVVAGFPGDKPFAEMWGMAQKIKSVATDRLVYLLDSVGGQSGAPVYIKRNGSRYVVGIHNYGHSSGNSATRVTAAVYQNLSTWSKV